MVRIGKTTFFDEQLNIPCIISKYREMSKYKAIKEILRYFHQINISIKKGNQLT